MVKRSVEAVMMPEERRAEILRLAQAEAQVGVEDLASRLATSRETIRRDLTLLADRGLLLKFHGGARLPRPDIEGSFQSRMATNVAAKRAIARAAARIFEPGDTLFIDTGSTTLCLAEELGRLNGLTAITNAPALARAIANGDGGNRSFLIGGDFKIDNEETAGPLAIEQIRRFRPRYAVLTVGALDIEGGVMDYDIDEAQIAEAMIAQAERVVILADSSKFGKQALFQVCSLETADLLVTEAMPGQALLAFLEQADVRTIVAAE